MKSISLIFLLFFGGTVFAQSEIVMVSATQTRFISDSPNIQFGIIDYQMLAWPRQSELVSVSDEAGQLQKTYALNEDGETISSGFRPAAYFSPNDNLLVISAGGNQNKDSLNPNGAKDMPSAILLGTINNFISRLKIGNR